MKLFPYLTVFTLFLCLSIVSQSCSKKVANPSKYSGKQIIVGNGGGFTGAVSKYYILDNGDIYRAGMSDTSFVKMGKMPDQMTTQLFVNYETMKFGENILNEPGNRYYFITQKVGDKETKIQWGKNELSDKTPEIFYKNIMNIIKKTEEK